MGKVGWARRSWHAIGVVIGASVCTAASAGADPPAAKPGAAETTESVERQATRYYDAGASAARTGQWEKARQAFQEAFRIKAHPLIAGALGQAEFNTGQYANAAEHLSWFLREAVKATPAERQAVEKMLAEAKAKIGTVTVRVDVDGADVLADGRPVGKSPLAAPVFVEPGSRQFKATKEGHGTGSLKLEVPAGLELEVKLTLALPQNVLPQSAAAQAPAPSSPPNARATPVPETTPGTAGPKWRTWAMIGGAGLTAVGLGVGIGLTVTANAKSTAADEQLAAITNKTPNTYSPRCGPDGFPPNRSACAELDDTLRAQDRLTNAAAAMYVIGGVAAVGTAALLVWPKLSPKRTGLRVVPALGAGYIGVVVLGSY